MEYKVCENTVIVRLERGEEIHPALEALCREAGILAGTLTGIGAVDRATLGIFKVGEKKYYGTELTGEMEVASLLGNISTKEGEPYLHLHATLGGDGGETWCGHLSYGRVSATCEIFIQKLPTQIERRMDEQVGINRMVL